MPSHTPGEILTHAARYSSTVAPVDPVLVMRPTADRDFARSQHQAATEAIPYTLPPSDRLQAGYIRLVQIIPEITDGDEEIIKLETCIRRFPPAEDSSDDAASEDEATSEHGATPGHGTPSYDQLKYLAFSYAWGDPTPRRPILVDSKRRMVAENLWQFLQIEKKVMTYYDSWLWIDALSINQSDAEERRHQVGIMATIFRNADVVVLWLGPSSDDSDLAMRALSAEPLTEAFQPVMEEYDINDPNFSTRWSKQMKKDMQAREKCVEDVLHAINNLCQRAYWKRLWVFQELRHAKKITLKCGGCQIPWGDFRSLWRVVAELGMFNDDTAEMLKNSLATRMITLRTKPMNFSLWNLLKETTYLDCADQRDRVYALLSVADEGHEEIEADYHASLSSLGHHILRNRYASRPPAFLQGVIADCEFLVEVLRLSAFDMFDYSASRGYTWNQKSRSHIDPSWAEWAEYHDHPAVTRLLQNCE